MTKKKVVVKGGGENLYEVGEYEKTFYIRKCGDFINTDIGKARSFDDALAIIRSHSGRAIEKIE